MAKIAIRPIRIEGNIAFVPLTKGYEAIIDVCDVHLVEEYNWLADVYKHTVYAKRNTPRNVDGKQTRIRMHRALMAAPPNLEVDHKNGDGLDNRRTMNLRLATRQQNQCNRSIGSTNTSGIKGVSWDCKNNKWQVQIEVNGKCKYLGRFTDITNAAAAYAKASAEMHGEFGRTA